MTAQQPRTRLPAPSPMEVLRREAYLLRLQVWLEELSGRERRDVVRDLRSQLDEATVGSSMRDAVAALGNPRALAREYDATVPDDRPRWSRGLTWASSWLIAWVLLIAVFSAALVQVAPALGAAGATARLLWVQVTAVDTATTTSVEVTSTWWTIAVGLVLLVLGAKAWRLVPALRPRR